MESSSFKRTDQLSQGKGCHVYREKQTSSTSSNQEEVNSIHVDAITGND